MTLYNIAGVAILVQDKVDFKIRNTNGNKEEYFMRKKGSIHQENITILNVYLSNNTASIYEANSTAKRRNKYTI